MLLAGWIGAQASLLAVTGRAEAVTVVFRAPAGSFALPQSVRLIEWNGHRGRFVGASGSFVADLYLAGAMIVLPARSGSCLDLSKSADARASEGGASRLAK